MNASRFNNALRLGALGIAMILMGGIVAMTNSPDSLVAQKWVYGLVMGGVMVLAGAVCLYWQSAVVRTIAVIVGVGLPLSLPIITIVSSVIAA